jgi:SPP1 gp7 family putative phage head morphogenesis protein
LAGKVAELNPKPKVQPPLTVTSVDGLSAYAFGVRQERYNPDMLAARKGGLRIYQRMQDDEQVKAVLKFKRDAIIGRGYEFVFDETKLSKEEQDRRHKVMQQTTRKMAGSFTDGIVGVLKGMTYGYSITEFVTQNIDVDGSQYVGIAKLLSRDASTFTFYTDDYGTLTRFTQRVGSREIDLDYSRFIHYVQNPEVDTYYGESELKSAYRAWFLKDLDLKLWAAYKERMAGGFMSIELGESGLTPQSPDYQALQSMLTNMRSTMGIILPRGVTAEMHTPGTTDIYEKAVQFHDLAIAKALLIPNLLGLSHTGQTGAYSQSQTQLEAFFMTLATDTERVEQCINDQLFRPLALQNWDDGEFPRFRFKKASEDHVKWVVQSWKDLSAAGAVITTEADERHLRELLDFSQRTDKDEAVAKVKQELVPIQVDPNKQSPGNPPGNQAADEKKFTADDVKQLIAESAEQQKSAFTDLLAQHVKPAKAAFSAESAMMRVDFAVMAQRTLALEEETTGAVAKLTAKATRGIVTEEHLTELLGKNADDIGQIEIDSVSVGRIKGAFRGALERSWAMGLNQAMTEMAKARKAAYSANDRKLRFDDLRLKSGDFFEAKAFKLAGDLTEAMRSIIQQELLNGIKASRRPEDVAARIYERFIRKGMTTLDAVKEAESRESVLAQVALDLAEEIGTSNVPAYLNTITRTSSFEALNEGRYAEFSDPAVADFVVALRYSAILDDRTTQICQELDGHVHAVKSAVWEEYRPPNHYNCRSILFAITKLDEWDGQESPEPSVKPQEGFK